jgi:hypothetical protein
MKTKIAFTVFAVAGIAIGVVCLTHRTPPQPTAIESKPDAVSPPVSNKPSAPIQVAEFSPPPIDSPTPKAPVAKSKAIIKPPAQNDTPADQADQPLVINGYVVQDPMARAALSYVGTDPDADAYWIAAINDPSLPTEERKDLIEDLNEDGLANPRLATPGDLAVIANRIQLIEDLAPLAIDEGNAKALAEAHKDLVNLYNGLPAD